MNLTKKDEVVATIKKTAKKNKIGVLEACLDYCAKNNIELEVFALFVKSARGKDLAKALQKDGVKLHLLKK